MRREEIPNIANAVKEYHLDSGIDAETFNVIDSNEKFTATTIEDVLEEMYDDYSGFPDELKNLVTGEIQQLENIGTEIINATNWGRLAALNQNLTSTSTPSFNSVTINNSPSVGSDAATKDYVDGLVQGSTVQPAVISFWDASSGLPVGPTAEDRYICSVAGNGWTIHYIYEWDGVSAWIETIPLNGFTCWVTDEDVNYVFNGTIWVRLGSTVTHKYLAGLQGGIEEEYYHLSSAQHTVATQAATGALNGYLSSTDWSTFNGKAEPGDWRGIETTPSTSDVLSIASSWAKTHQESPSDVRHLTDAQVTALHTIYSHPTGDGNLHVIETSTTNNGKVLTAGATAGSLSWTEKTTPYTLENHDVIAKHTFTGAAGLFLKTTGVNTLGMAEHGLTASDVGAAATIHNLVDTTNHPVSGLTTNHVLKATGATTYGFGAIQNVDPALSNGFLKVTTGTGLLSSDTTAYLPLTGGAITGDVSLATTKTFSLLGTAALQFNEASQFKIWGDATNLYFDFNGTTVMKLTSLGVLHVVSIEESITLP